MMVQQITREVCYDMRSIPNPPIGKKSYILICLKDRYVKVNSSSYAIRIRFISIMISSMSAGGAALNSQ